MYFTLYYLYFTLYCMYSTLYCKHFTLYCTVYRIATLPFCCYTEPKDSPPPATAF